MADVVSEFRCPNCDAPLQIKPGEPVTICEYCKTTVNLREDKMYVIKHSWMPANITEDRLNEIMRDWMSSGMMMPGDLPSKANIIKRELTYLPIWVFDAAVKTDYTGYFTRTGGREENKGSLEKDFFWKVLARRGTDFSVREYHVPLDGKVPFTIDQYPDGAKVLNGEIDETEGKKIAIREIEEHLKFLLSEKIDEFDSFDANVDFKDDEFVHVPIWFVKYLYKGREYSVNVDASQGQVITGGFPEPEMMSGKIKVALAIAGALLLLAILIGILL